MKKETNKKKVLKYKVVELTEEHVVVQITEQSHRNWDYSNVEGTVMFNPQTRILNIVETAEC